MIRNVGAAGPFRVTWLLVRALRWDLLAMLVVGAVMVAVSDVVPFAGTAAVVPLLGVVVSIFIGFRNSNAYSRWWEARSLWGAVVANGRALGNALIAIDDRSAEIAPTLDRMRRRQVRHAWQLAAELRGVPPVDGVSALTPEDPADASASGLLSLQAADVRDLVLADRIDRQARVILTNTNTNTAQAAAAGGLERIRNQPLPAPYAIFVRALAWLFAVLVCTRLDTGGHDVVVGVIVGFLLMAVFIVAERLGHFIEQPMSNTVMDLPMYRFCTGLTGDLLGRDHPLARPPEGADAIVWM